MREEQIENFEKYGGVEPCLWEGFGAKVFFEERKRPARVAGLSDISKKGGKLITAKSAIMKKPKVLVGVKRLLLFMALV